MRGISSACRVFATLTMPTRRCWLVRIFSGRDGVDESMSLGFRALQFRFFRHKGAV